MLMGLLPYVALQIDAVVMSASAVTGEPPSARMALGFCAVITLFAVLFGTRGMTPTEKHEGLVAAIAFESIIKLVASLAIGGYAFWEILEAAADSRSGPKTIPMQCRLYASVGGDEWTAVLMLSFGAAFFAAATIPNAVYGKQSSTRFGHSELGISNLPVTAKPACSDHFMGRAEVRAGYLSRLLLACIDASFSLRGLNRGRLYRRDFGRQCHDHRGKFVLGGDGAQSPRLAPYAEASSCRCIRVLSDAAMGPARAHRDGDFYGLFSVSAG